MYKFLKGKLQERQPDHKNIPYYQTLIAGFISGACGPLFNAPVDTIKTRIQKTPSTENGFKRVVNICRNIIHNEGYRAFYRGLTPRVLRVAPGQAITFLVQITNKVYEKVYSTLNAWNNSIKVEEMAVATE